MVHFLRTLEETVPGAEIVFIRDVEACVGYDWCCWSDHFVFLSLGIELLDYWIIGLLDIGVSSLKGEDSRMSVGGSILSLLSSLFLVLVCTRTVERLKQMDWQDRTRQCSSRFSILGSMNVYLVITNV